MSRALAVYRNVAMALAA